MLAGAPMPEPLDEAQRRVLEQDLLRLRETLVHELQRTRESEAAAHSAKDDIKSKLEQLAAKRRKTVIDRWKAWSKASS